MCPPGQNKSAAPVAVCSDHNTSPLSLSCPKAWLSGLSPGSARKKSVLPAPDGQKPKFPYTRICTFARRQIAGAVPVSSFFTLYRVFVILVRRIPETVVSSAKRHRTSCAFQAQTTGTCHPSRIYTRCCPSIGRFLRSLFFCHRGIFIMMPSPSQGGRAPNISRIG